MVKKKNNTQNGILLFLYSSHICYNDNILLKSMGSGETRVATRLIVLFLEIPFDDQSMHIKSNPSPNKKSRKHNNISFCQIIRPPFSLFNFTPLTLLNMLLKLLFIHPIRIFYRVKEIFFHSFKN